MATIDPTESQKAVADILIDDRNCFDLFSYVNQLLYKRKNRTLDKWFKQSLHPTPNCLVLICPDKVMNTLLTLSCQKMLIERAYVNYMIYHHRITRNSSLSKAVVHLQLEQSTSVNSKVNFGTKFP